MELCEQNFEFLDDFSSKFSGQRYWAERDGLL